MQYDRRPTQTRGRPLEAPTQDAARFDDREQNQEPEKKNPVGGRPGRVSHERGRAGPDAAERHRRRDQPFPPERHKIEKPFVADRDREQTAERQPVAAPGDQHERALPRVKIRAAGATKNRTRSSAASARRDRSSARIGSVR